MIYSPFLGKVFSVFVQQPLLTVSIYPMIHPESTWKKEIKKIRVLDSLRKTVQYSYPNSHGGLDKSKSEIVAVLFSPL